MWSKGETYLLLILPQKKQRSLKIIMGLTVMEDDKYLILIKSFDCAETFELLIAKSLH